MTMNPTAKEVTEYQDKKSHEDNIRATIEMFFKHQMMGPLPVDPYPLWEEFRKTSEATNDAYVTLVMAHDSGWEFGKARRSRRLDDDKRTQELWDIYQMQGNKMWSALEAYDEAMQLTDTENLMFDKLVADLMDQITKGKNSPN